MKTLTYHFHKWMFTLKKSWNNYVNLIKVITLKKNVCWHKI